VPDDALLTSLLAAVDASPDDVPLRLHVADLLASRDRLPEALAHCTQALSRAPGDPQAVAMLQRLTAAIARPVEPQFDWQRAEEQIGPVPEFAHKEFTQKEFTQKEFTQEFRPDAVTEDVERPALRLADVGGMEHVKERLEMTLLGPMRNPEMAKAFGATTGGGLLLYGPPGCGKTFIAKAVAGELGASFYEVGIADVLDMYTGSSERNLAQVFDAARRNAPCVLFFDEVDALGQKRSHLTHSSSMRNTVNTLLAEMDSLGGTDDGVFVLGATNHPWDVDSALRRPGRFDRMLLVLPPDAAARAAILRHHLRDRPLAGIDLDALARSTEHFSGADLAHLCATASERALADSMRAGTVRPVGMADFGVALREVRPSTGPWFATARNVVAFANTDGSYDDLAAYLKQNRRL
jgi:SpoVK/Ycf46/Vps4 family AAA+-type ATPase